MRDLTNAALLIIGMQQGSNDLRLGQRNNPQAEASMQRLLQAWRAAQRPIVHVRHVSRSPDSLYYPGKPGVEFQPEFMPRVNEHVIEKNVPDSFSSTGLEDWLRAQGVKQVVIAGNVTNNSVEATARNAGNLGFTAFVPADATFTFDKTD
ncbi:MAG: cysteine hydrolase family protein, partial [Noviherbaspirillum sp.]